MLEVNDEGELDIEDDFDVDLTDDIDALQLASSVDDLNISETEEVTLDMGSDDDYEINFEIPE